MKFEWEAKDQKLGMTAEEMIRGVGHAKMSMGVQTRITLQARIGWNGQIKSVRATAVKEDQTQTEELTFMKSGAPPA